MCKYRTEFSLELFQESHVRTHKISHIRYTISDHHETIESESECKTTIYLRIESSLTYDIGMDESCSHEFDPTRPFTDLASDSITKRTREIDLHSWFNKREVPRTHTDRHLFSEYIWEHGGDSEFQMTDTDSLVYDDPLYLIERIIMSSIDIFIAKYSSRDDSSDRCRLVPHYQILHTGRLSCEHITWSLQPECILHISCWMRLRDIHCIEVEILRRHLHRVIDIESHAYKCILHLPPDECDWMETSLQFL